MRKLVVLFCTLVPLSASAWTFRFAKEWKDSEISTFETTAQKFENELSERFLLSPLRLNVKVEKLPRGARSNWLGESAPGKIRLRWSNESPDRDFVLKHELAHLWFAKTCGQRSLQFPAASEIVAQFLSGDMNRLAGTAHEFQFNSQAQAYLSKTDFAFRQRDKLEAALGRALVQLEARPRAKLVAQIQELAASNCTSLAEFDASAKGLLLANAKSGSDHKVSHRIDSLWIDLNSKEILSAKGDPSQKRPMGSVLKPLLLDSIPELRQSKVAGVGPEWRCGYHTSNHQVWSWEEALTYSCNGFFLDSKVSLDSFYAKLVKILSLKESKLSMAEAIGVIPTLNLSLFEIAALYSDLYEHQSIVLPILKKTIRHGTLEKTTGTDLFAKLGVEAKTGTRVSNDGAVFEKYLVLIVPEASGTSIQIDGDKPVAPQLLILRGEGLSLQTLVDHAVELLQRRPSPVSQSIKVSVLSLLPNQNLDITCADGPGRLITNALTTKCLTGPLVVRTFSSAGVPIEKHYFGSLTRTTPSDVQSTGPSRFVLTERQSRARKGSQWVLQTSARQYIAQTLIDEASGMQDETLKALGEAILQNALYAQGSGKPICDTTLCQVFTGSARSDRELRRYLAIADDVIAKHGLSQSQKRLFYLGGEKPWKKTFTKSQAAELLGRPRIYDVVSRDNNFVINGEELSCELVRSSLHFLSCPAKLDVRGDRIEVSGRGEGHGVGMNLLEANLMALKGSNATEIFRRFYQ